MKQDILNKIKEYVEQQAAARPAWVAGVDQVNYAGNYFGSEEYVAASNALLSGWLGLSTAGNEFESKFPALVGQKCGVLTNSGSSSNLLMMASLTSQRGYNFPKGTKVITPVAGFPTTLNPILQLGFEPVFVDIELDTLNIDLDQVSNALAADPDIKVITFAHVLGNPPNMDRVMALVEQHNLVLLEDCCDALGSTYKGKPLGSFGVMSSCSFYPAHHMTMGEGGFVSCNTTEQRDIVRSFRDWGRGCYCSGPEMNRSSCGSCGKRFSAWLPSMPDQIMDHKYVYEEIGYNLKPIEIQAAMGLEQLKKLDSIHAGRRANYAQLMSIYSKYEDFFILPRPTEGSDPSWFAFPLTVRPDAPFSRIELVEYLESKLIQTRPYFAGNFLLQPAYSELAKKYDFKKQFPNAVIATTNTFFHGTAPTITSQQIDYIGSVVDSFMSLFV